jgi:NitT/TauT family transport system substrate-binding protein
VKRIALLSLTLVFSFVLAACGAATTPTQTPPTAIKYQMGWTHDYSSAGFYDAEKNGHFAEQNLNVTLIQGGYGDSGFIAPIPQLLNGSADFTLVSVSDLLEARANGQPIVAIATLNQRSPSALLSLPDSNITRPADLIGKTVALNAGGAMRDFQSLLISQNIDPASVNVVERTTFDVQPLLNHDVDVLGGWIINEAVALREAGQEPNVMLLSDYGIDSYDLLVVTTEDMVKNKPDVVQRFLRATLAGWADVVSDPDKSAGYVLTYNSTLDLAGQKRRIQALIPLINPAGSHIGMMQADVWQFDYQQLVDNGILTKPLDVNTAYTMTFLNQIYPQ